MTYTLYMCVYIGYTVTVITFPYSTVQITMATTRPFLVASNTGETEVKGQGSGATSSYPTQLPIFPPEHVVKAQAFYSPIHTAIYNPNLTLTDIESMILSDPSCVHQVHPQNGYTPLHAAVRRAHIGMIRMIMSHSGNIEAKANEGETPLNVACQVSYAHVQCRYVCRHAGIQYLCK